jgi:hypothetical protein
MGLKEEVVVPFKWNYYLVFTNSLCLYFGISFALAPQKLQKESFFSGKKMIKTN